MKKCESPSVCKLWLGSAAGVSDRPGVQSGAGEPMGQKPCHTLLSILLFFLQPLHDFL